LSDVVTGEAVVIDVPCARFPSRMAALAVDIVVQLVVLITLSLAVVAAGGNGGLNAASETAITLSLSILIIVGYPTIFETLSRGRSLGKLALGLRVVSDDGGPERFRQALVRALASVVEIWTFLGCPALVTSMLSAKGKRLGDLFAGTFVIQERLPGREQPAPMMPPPLAAWAACLELSGLPDETAAMARGYLGRYWELAPAAREEFGNRIAADVASRVSPPPPPGTPPPAYLSAVLAERRRREQARLAAQQAAQAGYTAPAPGTLPPPWAGVPGTPPPPWAGGQGTPPDPWAGAPGTPPPPWVGAQGTPPAPGAPPHGTPPRPGAPASPWAPPPPPPPATGSPTGPGGWPGASSVASASVVWVTPSDSVPSDSVPSGWVAPGSEPSPPSWTVPSSGSAASGWSVPSAVPHLPATQPSHPADGLGAEPEPSADQEGGFVPPI
jgi:uncharacterized RDD family membrane protein YckC